MYWEMVETMKNNFTGTSRQRFIKAKKQFLESVGECILQNKEDIISEVESDLNG